MAQGYAGSSSYAMSEINQMLDYFNQQQSGPEEMLQPVEKWCKIFVETLQLQNDHDILSVDAEEAVARVLSAVGNESTKEAVKKFFFEHLMEINILNYVQEAESILQEFSEPFLQCSSDAERNAAMQRVNKEKILVRLVENLRNLKLRMTDDTKFENVVAGLCGIDQFKRVLLGFSYRDDSALIEQLTPLSAVSQTILPVAEDVMLIVKATKLEGFLSNKISISKLTEISLTDAEQSVEGSAWRLLRGLTDCNYESLNEARSATELRSFRERLKRQESESLHPMDILHSSFLCCDIVAKQFLCQRLFACKLAFPFLYKNEFNQLVQSNWALRDISFEFSDKNSKMIDMSLVGDGRQLPMVSFMRFGDIDVSKSKVLNHILNPKRHETFSNRFSTNGKVRRTCSNGLVEAAVRLPSRNSQTPEFLALNLRGDMNCHPEQTERLSQMSEFCVLFVCGKELLHSVERIKNIKVNVTGMVIVISTNFGSTIDEDKLLKAYEQHFEPIGIDIVIASANSGDRSEADYISEIQLALDKMLLQRMNSSPQQLSDSCGRAEAGDTSLDAIQKAERLYKKLCNYGSETHRAFPLQGDLWKKLSECQRALSATRATIAAFSLPDLNRRIDDLHNNQIEAFQSHSCTQLFISDIRELKLKSERLSYIESLRLLLESHTRRHMSQLRKKYLQLKSEFKASVEATKQSDESRSDQGKEGDPGHRNSVIHKELHNAESDYQKSSVSLHHFFREAALLYDAYAHVREANMPDEIRQLPNIFASLLLSGVSLELLDGTAGNIPMKWISALLDECKRLVGNKKLFVVSVLGTQSTGKSTLLNTMFGLRLPVSVGRCTRGAFLQLVPVSESSQLPFDYLAVIDTEGLRAVERGDDSHRHDNELATLVIGLADLTLIVVNGEDSPEMRDVLQIVIHAFINMKAVQSRLDIKRKCLFVHQNVCDAAAIERLKTEILKRQSELDLVTKAAAEKKGVNGVKSFSDIILFSPESDTFLMPGLWHGSPPMAPVNPDFSKDVQRLKQQVIKIPGEVQAKSLNFTDFVLRTNDLWKAVLTENFVFFFRNSIEMKAYRLLEEEFAQIRTLFRTLLLDYFKSTIKPGIEKEQDMAKARAHFEEKLLEQVNRIFLTSRSELSRYFAACEYKQYVSQWQEGKVASLQSEKESLQFELKRKLSKIIKLREVTIQQNKKINAEKSELRREASNLAQQQGNHATLTEQQLIQRFEFLWEKALNRSAEEESPCIEETLKNELLSKFQNERHCIEDLLSKVSISSLAADPDFIEDLSELTHSMDNNSVHSKRQRIAHALASKAKRFKELLPFNFSFFSGDASVLAKVKHVLRSVQNILNDIESRQISFNDSDARLLVQQTCQLLDITFNQQKQKDEPNDLKVQVAVYACRMAHEAFTRIHLKFMKKLSLKSRLVGMKELMFGIFKGQALASSKDIAAVEIQNALQSTLKEMLEAQAEAKLMQMYHEQLILKNSKQWLIKQLLCLIIDEDASLAELYFTDPKAAALKFIQRRIDKTLLQSVDSNEPCKYRSTIDTYILRPAIDALQVAIIKPEACTTSDSWIDAFCSACSSSGISLTRNCLQEICQDAQFDFKDLSAVLTTKIHQVCDSVLKDIDEKIVDIAKHDDLPGIRSLCRNILDCLWGCDHCCPLCNEPCIRMDSNHVENDKTPHRCAQHRPMGLKGTELVQKNELAKYTCSYFATSVSKVLQGTKGVFGKHKKFRCSGCSNPQSDCSATKLVFHKCYKYMTYFPDWDIEPSYSAPVSDLWKWLASSNRASLIAKCKHYSKIPEEWRNSTKEGAKLSLDKVFDESDDTTQVVTTLVRKPTHAVQVEPLCGSISEAANYSSNTELVLVGSNESFLL